MRSPSNPRHFQAGGNLQISENYPLLSCQLDRRERYLHYWFKGGDISPIVENVDVN